MTRTSHVARRVPWFNPEGIVSSSPGLRGTSYPGRTAHTTPNPNGVASFVSRLRHNPVGVENILESSTQGSSFLATLGWMPESRWDSNSDLHDPEAIP
jgi:hypothetical protein